MNFTNKAKTVAGGASAVREAVGIGGARAPRSGTAATTHALRALALVALAAFLALALANGARAQATVGLGTAEPFAVLGGSEVTNTGPSVLNGNLGLSPGPAVTGFPPGIVNGETHVANAVALQAQADLVTAYDDAAGRPCASNLTGQDLGGLTLTSGVYCFDTTAQLTGMLVLNGQGNPNSVFIIQVGSSLTTASASVVRLVNGAQSCNVFWQIGVTAAIGTTTRFRGNVLALTSITAGTGATVHGRLLARNAEVTLQTNTITRARCDARAPTVIIGGAPGDGVPGNPVAPGPSLCVDTDFRLRIRARDPAGIRRVDVFVDGMRIKRTTRADFYVWVRTARLTSGRHTLRVRAVDRLGNVRVTTRSFRICDRVSLPFFTG